MSFSREIAARTLFGEARGEPEIGRRAVAHVFVNRYKSGRWGKSLGHVCHWRAQFSCWNDNDPNAEKLFVLADDDATLVELRAIVDAAATGQSSDPTAGATHYHAIGMDQDPSWVAGATFCGQFGNHKFYKNVR